MAREQTSYEQTFKVGKKVVVANKIHARPSAKLADEVNYLRLVEHVKKVTVANHNIKSYTINGDPATTLDFAGIFERSEKIRVIVETDSPPPEYGTIEEGFRRIDEIMRGGGKAGGYKPPHKSRHAKYPN
jgi:hypothetical protein